MFHAPESSEDLARLRHDRAHADRTYNDALTALDGAIQRLREMPHPPPPYDEHQVSPLNERWNLQLQPPQAGGWFGRLRDQMWGLVAPFFERQQMFNAALVDHINRNVAIHRETRQAIASTLAVLNEELARLVDFQTKLILYAQQVTPYVDTKDRYFAGFPVAGLQGLSYELQKRWEATQTRLTRDEATLSVVHHGLAAGLSELSDGMHKRWETMGVRANRTDATVSTVHRELAAGIHAVAVGLRGLAAELPKRFEAITVRATRGEATLSAVHRELAAAIGGVSAGIGAVGDELAKRSESMVAHEQRYEAQVNEVRSTLGVMQRVVQMLKRELDHPAREAPATAIPAQPVAEPSARPAAPTPPPAAAPAATWATSERESYKYVGFEDQFRGSEDDIRQRMTAYLPYFQGASDVLDIGCGRGEFLDLLRAHGVSGRGVDINPEMAAITRARGLDATAGDALSYLAAQPDGSLGGLVAFQVVEHLEPDYLIRLLETAYDKLRPGSRIILETINPACWYAFFASYIRDVTHVRPLHPDTLQYFLIASGFQKAEIRYSAPFPEESKLQRVPAPAARTGGETAATDPLVAIAAVLNENVNKLNSLMFTYLDYAVIGSRL